MLSLFIATTSFAYEDLDMDGVEDKIDRCPNTSFNDLVDIRGCAIKSLTYEEHFDVIVGVNYSDSDYRILSQTDTFSTSVQADYYYKDFSFQAYTSYFTTADHDNPESGLYDSFLGVYYKEKLSDSLFASVGTGIFLPTYETSLHNNNADYILSLNLSYAIEDMNIFGGYAYTLINDDDVKGVVSYQNTKALSVGLGYYIDSNLYMSVAYNATNSIYRGEEDMRTLSFYANYTIDANWFSMFTYARGLSDSAINNYASIRLGYYF